MPARVLFIGLDYAAVRAGLAAEDLALSSAEWRGLRLMEREALDTLKR